jgi:hypothetical protein
VYEDNWENVENKDVYQEVETKGLDEGQLIFGEKEYYKDIVLICESNTDADISYIKKCRDEGEKELQQKADRLNDPEFKKFQELKDKFEK